MMNDPNQQPSDVAEQGGLKWGTDGLAARPNRPFNWSNRSQKAGGLHELSNAVLSDFVLWLAL
jgi:hypothetical protein